MRARRTLARRASFWRTLALGLTASAAPLAYPGDPESAGTGATVDTVAEQFEQLAAADAEPLRWLETWVASGEPRAELECLEAVLDRWSRERPADVVELVRAGASSGQATRARLWSAAGSVGDARVLPVLLEVLGSDPALDLHALVQIGKCGPLPTQRQLDQARRGIGPWVADPEPAVAAAAIEALAALGCVEAAPLLVERLADERSEVAAAAHAGLRVLTERDLRPDVETWEAFLEADGDVRRSPFGERLAELRYAPKAELADRVRELAGAGLHRHEVAAAVAELLERPEPEVRVLACSTLGGLGSGRALGPLVEARSDPGTAEAAEAALRRLAGRQETDWAAWLEDCEDAR